MSEQRKLGVRFEAQSTGYTCAAKALQLVLNYFDASRYPLGVSLEMGFWDRARLGKYSVATCPGLALIAVEEGFEADYVAYYRELFRYPTTGITGYVMPREEFNEKLAIDKNYFAKATEKGLRLRIIRPDQVVEEIKEYLNVGTPLIAMVDYSGILHTVVIRGYKRNTFYMVDPIGGYRSTYVDHLFGLVNTRYGLAILAISEAFRSNGQVNN